MEAAIASAAPPQAQTRLNERAATGEADPDAMASSLEEMAFQAPAGAGS